MTWLSGRKLRSVGVAELFDHGVFLPCLGTELGSEVVLGAISFPLNCLLLAFR
jgi:hypothetical protein